MIKKTLTIAILFGLAGQAHAFSFSAMLGDPKDHVQTEVEYNPQRCDQAYPLLLTITNNSNETIERVSFKFEGRRPGHSSRVYHNLWPLNDDTIIAPSKSHTLCWSIPKKGNKYISFDIMMDKFPPAQMEWGVDEFHPWFEN